MIIKLVKTLGDYFFEIYRAHGRGRTTSDAFRRSAVRAQGCGDNSIA